MTKLFSDTVTLKQNYFYSLFLANETSKPEIFLLTDTLTRPPANMASIRFVDLSPDAPAVDLVLNDTLKIATNKIFKGHSSFISLTGNSSYNLEVRQSGTSTALASLSNLTLNTNEVYTIIFDGLAASTSSTDKLSIFYVINAQYF
jgi:hypothetical protein